MVERRVSANKEPIVVHVHTGNFILNSAAFYSTELHRKWANITFEKPSSASWRSAVSTGLQNWENTLKQKQEQKDKQSAKGKGKQVAADIGAPTRATGANKKRKACRKNLENPQESQTNQEPSIGGRAGPSNSHRVN